MPLESCSFAADKTVLYIKGLLKAPQGWHAVTYGFQLDALTIYRPNALSNNQTYDTYAHVLRFISKQKKKSLSR